MAEELRLVPRAAGAPSPTMRDLLAVVFRQRRLLLLCFAGIWSVVLAYGLLAPSYESEMKVLVRRGREDPVITPAPTPRPFEREDVSEEAMNSEVELLRDQEILRQVAEVSGLANRSNWISKLRGDAEPQRLARAVRRLSQNLNVEPLRKTTLITVTYASSDPAQAESVLQYLAGAYLERHTRVHRPSGESGFFERQVEESRHNLEDAELQLMEFGRDQGVVSAAQERDIALQRLGEAQANDRENRIAMAQTAQRIRLLQLRLPFLPERLTTSIRNTDNPLLLEKMKSRLLELQLQRTQLLTKFEPTYRLVQEVDREIAETRQSIANEELAPVREQTSDLDPNHVWAREELLKAEVELSGLHARSRATAKELASDQDRVRELGEHAVKQEDLVNRMKAAEQEYLLYVSKREEARIGDALDEERILNVTIAEQPTLPALPMRSSLSYGLLGFVLAGGIGTGAAFVADRLDPGFRTPDEVYAYLGTPVLASLPESNS